MDQAAGAARRQGKSALRRLTAVALLGLACASPGMPPGGPPDVAAPQIVAIIPDSGTLGVKPKDVVFRFDEVVAERPPSVTTLSDLFLISPRDGSPKVSWHRDAISVRPEHGWRTNTAYTVIMMRGLADIRGNVRNTGASTFFSTGQLIPRTRVTGHVFDWVSGSPANGALVESFVQPDTIHAYVALADSNGAFALEHLPPARYTIRAYVDRNKNQGIDPSEPWDSVSVSLTDSATTELLVFTHDSVPPRIRDISAIDSVTLRVTFDKPVNPAQTLTASNFAVIGPDSVPVPIVSAGPPPKDTSTKINPALGLPPAAPTPSRPPPPPRPVPGRRDTTAVVAKPVMSRPAPISDAVIKLQRPLTPKTTYRVRALGIEGLLGHTGNSERAFTTAAPLPPPKPSAPPPASTSPVKK